jgi:hypothetical protein
MRTTTEPQKQALRVISISFPASLLQFTQDLLSLSLAHLESLLPPYTRFYLEELESPPADPEEGPAPSLPNLVQTIFDFTTHIQRKPKLSAGWFTTESNLYAVIRATFQWSQMTKDDVSIYI